TRNPQKMSNVVIADVGHNGVMTRSGPRGGGPTPRRSFTPAQKLEFLAEYEDACTRQQGGALLREQGVYSSQMTAWRKLRDAGVLRSQTPGERIGKLSNDRAEIARLRRQLEVSGGRLTQTEAALDVMGKLHDLLENLSENTTEDPKSMKP